MIYIYNIYIYNYIYGNIWNLGRRQETKETCQSFTLAGFFSNDLFDLALAIHRRSSDNPELM